MGVAGLSQSPRRRLPIHTGPASTFGDALAASVATADGADSRIEWLPDSVGYLPVLRVTPDAGAGPSGVDQTDDLPWAEEASPVSTLGIGRLSTDGPDISGEFPLHSRTGGSSQFILHGFLLPPPLYR